MMSLKIIPGCGQSGTSRIFVVRSTRRNLRDEAAQVAPEEALREVLRQLAERLQVRSSLPTPLGVPRADRGCDDRLEQVGLAVGGCSELAEMSRREPEARQLAARRRNVEIRLGVQAVAALDPRLEQAEVLQLTGELRIDACAVAELSEVELALLVGKTARLAPASFLRERRGKLLANHAERQELVPLQPEDRFEPVDVVLRKKPVAALRSLRRDQPLALEVANLGDRDVRELRLQPITDGADRQQPLASACLGCAHRRKVSRYLPICSSSPSVSAPDSMRRRLRNVPLRLPRSSIVRSPSCCMTTA